MKNVMVRIGWLFVGVLGLSQIICAENECAASGKYQEANNEVWIEAEHFVEKKGSFHTGTEHPGIGTDWDGYKGADPSKIVPLSGELLFSGPKGSGDWVQYEVTFFETTGDFYFYYLGHSAHSGADNYHVFFGRDAGSNNQNPSKCVEAVDDEGGNLRNYEMILEGGNNEVTWGNSVQDFKGSGGGREFKNCSWYKGGPRWKITKPGTYPLTLMKVEDPHGNWHAYVQMTLDKMVLTKNQGKPTGAGEAATYKGCDGSTATKASNSLIPTSSTATSVEIQGANTLIVSNHSLSNRISIFDAAGKLLVGQLQPNADGVVNTGVTLKGLVVVKVSGNRNTSGTHRLLIP